MIKKCPGCGATVSKFPVMTKEGRKKVYLHPETFNNCQFRDDGVSFMIEVRDPLSLQKFQELIEEFKPELTIKEKLIQWLNT